MKFVHTICYPDKSEIDVFERIIEGEEVINILSSFDFNAHLNKPIEFYSPSIDFIRLHDKKRLIFSGLGERKLKEFQVMYIIPSNTDFTNVFNEKNYLGSTEYTKIVSVSDAFEMLNSFVKSEDDKLLKLAGGYEEVDVVVENNKTPTTVESRAPKVKKHNPSKKEGKARPNQIIRTIITIICRILFLCLVVFFALTAYGVYVVEGQMNAGTIVVGAIAVLMLVATIKVKIDFDDL